MAVADPSSPPRLEALLAVTRLVRAGVPRLELVEAVAATIATSLGFRTVAIHLRRPGSSDFAVAAVHGGPEVRAALSGTTSTWTDWAPLLVDRHLTVGAYLVEDALFAPLTDTAGELLGVISVDEPATGRRPSEEDLALLAALCSHLGAALELADANAAQRAAVDSEARKSAMLEASLDAIVTVAADRTILEFNPAAQRIFGYTRDEALGRDVSELLIPPALREGHRRQHDRVLGLPTDQGSIDHRFEMPAMRADGSTFPSEIAVARIELAGPPLLTAFVRDISDRVAAREALEGERDQARHAAMHDPVTGLPNRSGALHHISSHMSGVAATGGALLAVGVELDGLELINQSLGFAHGDDLLRAVGQRLSRRGGAWGWLVAHTGRREFLVLVFCADPSPAVTEAIAQEVAATIDRPFAVKGLDLQVGAVVGHALQRSPDADPADLLRRVGVAGHQARAGGRVAAYDAATDVSHRTLTRLSALHGAVDRSELELHYQPLFRVGGDRNLIGVEALLRWRHEGALVPPGDFIGLAETSGLIGSIGEWVIGEACRQARAWGEAGLMVPVMGINVSPRQLTGDVAGAVEAALAEHGLAPDRICIEVTESAIHSGERPMIDFLRRLQVLGVRSAIDDFGAEYSSLNRIASVPVQMIKLDRGFLRKVPEDARARRLLAGVIGVAKGLGVTTVIEGVERRSQLELLAGMGADVAQGFLLARPEPAETVVARLARRPPGT